MKSRRKTPGEGVNGYVPEMGPEVEKPEVTKPELKAEVESEVPAKKAPSSKPNGTLTSLFKKKQKHVKSQEEDVNKETQSKLEEEDQSSEKGVATNTPPLLQKFQAHTPQEETSPVQTYATVDKPKSKPVKPETAVHATTIARIPPHTHANAELSSTPPVDRDTPAQPQDPPVETYAIVDKNRNKPIKPKKPKNAPPSSPRVKPAVPKKPKPPKDIGANAYENVGKVKEMGDNEETEGNLYQNVEEPTKDATYENVRKPNDDEYVNLRVDQSDTDLHSVANESGRKANVGDGSATYVNVQNENTDLVKDLDLPDDLDSTPYSRTSYV